MTPNEYLRAVLKGQTFANNDDEMVDLRERRDDIKALLLETFNESKPAINWAGSKAKGTMIKASYDGDVTFYFDHDTDDDAGDTLQEIYDDVAAALGQEYSVERKTSALRVRDKKDWKTDLHIDVVPGRYTDDGRSDVFLYQEGGEKSRLKTNLQKHIDHIRDSGVRPAIRLGKYWRTLNGISSAKTFVLELLIVELLTGRENDPLEDQLLHVFEQFRNNASNLSVKDPANSNNDLTPILDRCRWQLSSVAESTLWQIENNGWSAVFGEVEDTEDKAAKSAALSAAVVHTESRTRPWAK
jgi:hypothetical protein